MRPIILAAMVGCGAREIPPHLRPDASTAEAIPSAPSSTPEAAIALVGRDPLVRRAGAGTVDWADGLGTPALAAWAALVRAEDTTAADWHELERSWPGTIAVPLARGARLAGAEVALAQRDAAPMDLLAWAVPLAADPTALPADARPPLHWLGPTRSSPHEALLHVMEREVVLGWLDGPGLPVAAPVDAMVRGIHDRLTDSPTGRLLVAHAQAARAPERAALGRDALKRASRLVLLGAAADRDREQAAHAAEVEAARLGEKDRDPVARLLTEAAEALTEDAGNPESVGAALVALTGARLLGTCTDVPCSGLDRVGTLAAADRWGAGADATLWRVIAWKRALDHLEVARIRPSLPQALVDMVDVLRGTSPALVSPRLLLASRADPGVWLALTRATGGSEGTDWEEARAALAARVASSCAQALEHPRPDDVTEALHRIQRRAAQAPHAP